MQTALRIAISVVLALLLVLLGLTLLARAYLILSRWGSISALYAACGVVWVLAGAAMAVGGLLVLGSLGRRRFPLWMGGGAAVLAGAVLVVGVLTYVVPCSGPG